MENRVRELLDEHTHLYGIKVTASGERRQVDVSVDKPGGMSLDECSELHRRFYHSDFYCEYETYDVTFGTPGIARKCDFPVDFQFHSDRLFELTTKAGDCVVGKVKILDTATELLELRTKSNNPESDEMDQIQRFHWSDIRKARFYVEF